ncbi:MAG: low molecular weight phosphotyrosine protein phosphatase [Chitinophagales bacterium]|nr:low molecular weight phosphotyrosine protein phosphatase [Chitinophagales bacterium]MDW8428062.1 low molecular weight protein-tyrosine-phosphatase [Chitinophagales bacterium]
MKLLFVCLGNICRSPMAEGVMRKLIAQHQLPWVVDSAGIEHYHIGERPDRRAIAQCLSHGIDISYKRARLITPEDFKTFDFIYALSADVRDELLHFYVPSSAKIHLLLDVLYPGQNRSVPDPWYGSQRDFALAFELIDQACRALIKVHADGHR